MRVVRFLAACAMSGVLIGRALAILPMAAALWPAPVHAQVPHLVAAPLELESLDVANPQETIPPSHARAPHDDPSVEALIARYASEYGVSDVLMRGIVRCETAGSMDPTMQSAVRYAFSDPSRGIYLGDRERSYGLAQIHLPDNPSVTKAEATDPDFALAFMAKEIAAGHASWRWKICYARTMQF